MKKYIVLAALLAAACGGPVRKNVPAYLDPAKPVDFLLVDWVLGLNELW